MNDTRSDIKTKNRIYIIRIACWLVVIMHMTVIFLFSNQDGNKSNNMSRQIAQEVKKVVTLPEVVQERNLINKIDFNYVIRRLSHFTEYFILAVLLYCALRLSHFKTKRAFLLAIILCASYAGMDEFHQSFIIERTSKLKDVALDSAGAAFGLVCACWVEAVCFRKAKSRSN